MSKYNNEYYRETLGEVITSFKDGEIAGLDMSLGGFGVVVICAKTGELKDKLLIQSKLRGVERLVEIRRAVKHILKQYDIKLAITEGYAFGTHSGRSFDIGELGGVIKQSLYMNHIQYYIITPLMLKKWITGSSRGDKAMMLMKILKNYKIELNNNNIGDAYGLARIGYTMNRIINNEIKTLSLFNYQVECIKTIITKKK